MAYATAGMNHEIDTLSLRRYSPAPIVFNVCACSVSYDCPELNWSAGEFQCYYGRNCTRGTVIWTVPGMVRSCTPLDSVMSSDLRCFYDQSCVDQVLLLYNVDMPDRPPLSTLTRSIKALHWSSNSSFSPNDTVKDILSKSMIEQWPLESNFDGYYETCAPSMCQYTISKRFDIGYIVQNIATIFGGFVVTLRLLVPFVARLARWGFRRESNRAFNGQEQDRSKLVLSVAQIFSAFLDVHHRCGNTRHQIKQSFLEYNLFKKESSISTSPHAAKIASISSRMYIVLLSICLFLMTFFVGLDQKIVSNVVTSPSLTVYEKLQELHSTTLSCPCSQMITPYGSMISITPTFHQVSSKTACISKSVMTEKYLSYPDLFECIRTKNMDDTIVWLRSNSR